MSGKTYLAKHRKDGWRYRRAVPRDLLAAVGKAEWSAYLGQTAKAAAEGRARAMAVRHDGLIARLRALPAAERKKILSMGGIDGAASFVDGTDVGLIFIDHLASKPLRSNDPYRAGSALVKLEAQDEAAQMRDDAAPVRQLLAKIDTPAGTGSLETLIDLWVENTPSLAASSIEKTKLYTKRFVAVVGDLDPKSVTRQQALTFRDDLEKRKGITVKTGDKHLHALHRLFAVALNEGIVDSNPFHKVGMRRAVKVSAAAKKGFEIEQVRDIFAALGKAKHAKHSDDFSLMVRMLAYHGMRSGEAAHLRCEDVTTSMGVPVLRLTEEAGSKKNAQSIRDVPIHPAMLAEIAERAKVLGEGWLFPSFPDWKGKRGSWFQRNGGTFLRKHVRIADKSLTMHSLRHLWRTMAREMNMPRAVSLAIMGHSQGKDDHEGYGAGPSLKLRAEWMARIELPA